MQKKFHDMLHAFKVQDFKVGHDKQSLEVITKECLHFTKETLDHAFSFHFHKLPDAGKAELINMINNYVLEALMPPIVEKLVQRQLILEHRYQKLVGFLESMLEELSKPH
ncbi:MAG: hypothetical protein IPN34_03605 [Planctomycetes bacterium]|nr:hypothetical protein [Planctomycetota bacterium]